MSLPDATVFIATSLDGYIAREDGSIDWLTGRSDDDGGDYGYADLMASVDALVMGRHTYEKVLSFDAWPYGTERVVVLSSGTPTIPPALRSTVEVLSLEPAAVLRRLGANGVQRVYVDGGQTIQRFLRAGLIREMIITRIPVLLGSGLPLFGPLDEDIEMEHVGTQSFSSGLVQSHYRIAP